jgi:hypothetical protein
MIVKKQFASDCGDLAASMDQLVEALAQLLEEPSEEGNQGEAADLHSRDNRVNPVIENH